MRPLMTVAILIVQKLIQWFYLKQFLIIAALIAVAAADSAYPAYPKGYDYVSSNKMVIKEIFL